MQKQPIVLTYNGIVTEWTALPQNREAGAEFYDVTLRNFQSHLKWLKDNNCVVMTQSATTSNKNVILTFDGGEMNNYDHAFPLLKKYGFSAYFFIISKRVGQPGYMGWDELKEMHEAGMVIGSHGFSHGILTNLLDTQVEEELRASKKYPERNLNIQVDAFSVPGGFCNDKVIQMAYDAGYRNIFISKRPRGLKLDCFSRMAVRAGWSLKRFEQAFDGSIPIGERIFDVFRSTVKKVFGDSVYNWVRKVLLK